MKVKEIRDRELQRQGKPPDNTIMLDDGLEDDFQDVTSETSLFEAVISVCPPSISQHRNVRRVRSVLRVIKKIAPLIAKI